MVFMLRDAVFGRAIYEVGDFAANALQIDKAKHFSELVGNYSRFDFHHPGPAFFYVYAVGEAVFHDLVSLTAAPGNAHLLAGTLLQAAFLAAGIVAVAVMLPRRRISFVVVACAIALVHLHLVGHPQMSIWPPDVLLLPFFAFLASSAAMATGRSGFLPVAVVSDAFLVHGHTGQALFVVPIFVVTWMLLARAIRRERGPGTRPFLETAGRRHLVALILVAPFVLTLVLDALRGPASNVGRILAVGHPSVHPLDAIAFYILSFVTDDAPAGVIDVTPADQLTFAWGHLVRLVIVAGLIAGPVLVIWSENRRRQGRSPLARDLRTYWLVLFLAAALGVVWVSFQPGELFGFNSVFLWGLLYAAVLPAAMLVVDRLEDRWARAAVVAAGVVVGVVVLQPASLVKSDSTAGRDIHASLPRLLATTDPGRPIFLDMARLPTWAVAAG